MERLSRRNGSTPQRGDNNTMRNNQEKVINLNRNNGPKLVQNTDGKYNAMVSTTGHLFKSGRNLVEPLLHSNGSGTCEGVIISLH